MKGAGSYHLPELYGQATSMELDEAVMVPDSHPSTPEPSLSNYWQKSGLSKSPFYYNSVSTKRHTSSTDSLDSLLSELSAEDIDPQDWKPAILKAGAIDFRKTEAISRPQRKDKDQRSMRRQPGSDVKTTSSRHSSKASTSTRARRRVLSVYQSEQGNSHHSDSESSPVEVASARKPGATGSVPPTPKNKTFRARYDSDDGTPIKHSQETKPFSRRRRPKIPRPKEVGKGTSRPLTRVEASNGSRLWVSDESDPDFAIFQTDTAFRKRSPEVLASFIAQASSNAESEQLSAADIVAKVRARNMAKLGIVEFKPEPLNSTEDAPNSSVSQVDADSGDDLADPTLLYRSAMAYKPEEKPPPQLQNETAHVRLPKLPIDRSKFGLDSLFRKKTAAEQRGWHGIDAAAAEARKDAQLKEGTDVDSDDSLPDVGEAFEKTAGKKLRREDKLSVSAIQQVAEVLSDKSQTYRAVKLAYETMNEAGLSKTIGDKLEARRFFKADHLTIEPLVPYAWTGRKGSGRAICQSISNALKNPGNKAKNFHAELGSFFFRNSASLEIGLEFAHPLYLTIAHPSTPAAIGEQGLALLEIYLTLPAGTGESDIHLKSIITSLQRLGAKEDHIPASLLNKLSRSHSQPIGKTRECLSFTSAERRRAVLRILRVLEILVTAKRLDEEAIPPIVALLLRLALDPDDSDFRKEVVESLRSILNCMDVAGISAAKYHTLGYLRTASRREQFLAIRTLPYTTRANQWLIQALCYALLVDTSAEEEAPSTPPSMQKPDLAKLTVMLQCKTGESPFSARDDSNNEDLYYCTHLLQYLLTGLSNDMLAEAKRDSPMPESKKPGIRDQVRSLAKALETLDGRLRTDARAGDPMRNKAKNAIARMTHSLVYQLSDADERALRHKRSKIPHEVAPDGQISLSSFFKSKIPIADKGSNSNTDQ